MRRKNLKKFLFIPFVCLFFIACKSTSIESGNSLNAEFVNNCSYEIKTSFSLPSELIGTWKEEENSTYYESTLSLFDDNTYLVSINHNYRYLVGVYYTCTINNENYIQFNPKFEYTFNKQTISRTYYFEELKMKFDSNYKFKIESDTLILTDKTTEKGTNKDYVPEHFNRINEFQTLPKKISINKTELNAKEITLNKLRDLSKQSFLDYYNNGEKTQMFINLFKAPTIEQDGFTFAFRYPKPKNLPAKLKDIKRYTFRHQLARQYSGETYSYTTAYQINLPISVIQWIDENNCLLMFIRDYNSEFSDVYWCNTEDLGNVYNSRSIWCSMEPENGNQLFFQYLGEKSYMTQNGFTKKVPELKLFYANRDSIKDKKYTINDLYLFFEVLNQKYIEK